MSLGRAREEGAESLSSKSQRRGFEAISKEVGSGVSPVVVVLFEFDLLKKPKPRRIRRRRGFR